MLNMAVRNTKKLVRERVKAENVRIGRFFTKKGTAALMAAMTKAASKETVTVLDPGAGTGILSAALLERLCLGGGVKTVFLTCYETDETMLPMLENNLTRLRKKCRHDYGVILKYTILTDNFVTAVANAESPALYDYIIMNPPSDLCEKDSAEVKALGSLAAGATDVAFIFAALASNLLAEGGQMVALLPTTYAKGIYLERIRLHMLENARLTRFHLFAVKAKRDGVPDGVRPHMVLRFERTPLPENATVSISSSYSDGDGGDITVLPPFPYRRIVNEKNGALLLIKSEEEANVLSQVESFPESFSSYGLKMRTGLTLESRYPEALRDSAVDGAIPLIHPRSIDTGFVHLPPEKYIVPVIPSLAQKNKNMLFIKRVPAKSEKRHLLCGVYLAAQLPRCPMISTHNKLNYVDYADDREMDAAFLYGLYGVLSSDLYEKYCLILSTSPQINATEYGNLPLPDAKTLREIGQKLLVSRQFSPHACSSVVEAALRPKRSHFI
ncbi:MAG: methyltransferase [Clostridia bacterium]|nr:methyltransferase [Clostridia bacterium]